MDERITATLWHLSEAMHLLEKIQQTWSRDSPLSESIELAFRRCRDAEAALRVVYLMQREEV